MPLAVGQVFSQGDASLKPATPDACAGELADEELARKLQAEENARSSRRSDRASRLAAASDRARRSTRSAAAVIDASSEVKFPLVIVVYCITRACCQWQSASSCCHVFHPLMDSPDPSKTRSSVGTVLSTCTASRHSGPQGLSLMCP